MSTSMSTSMSTGFEYFMRACAVYFIGKALRLLPKEMNRFFYVLGVGYFFSASSVSMPLRIVASSMSGPIR